MCAINANKTTLGGMRCLASCMDTHSLTHRRCQGVIGACYCWFALAGTGQYQLCYDSQAGLSRSFLQPCAASWLMHGMKWGRPSAEPAPSGNRPLALLLEHPPGLCTPQGLLQGQVTQGASGYAWEVIPSPVKVYLPSAFHVFIWWGIYGRAHWLHLRGCKGDRYCSKSVLLWGHL